MEKLITFIVENHQLIILVLACVLDVVLFLVGVFKKKADPSLNSVLSQLPYFILAAEKNFGSGHGEEKKGAVMSCALALYQSLTGVEIKDGSMIHKAISDAIEEILITPRKKGN